MKVCPHCHNEIPVHRTETSIVVFTVTCGNSFCQEVEYDACVARNKPQKRKKD